MPHNRFNNTMLWSESLMNRSTNTTIMFINKGLRWQTFKENLMSIYTHKHIQLICNLLIPCPMDQQSPPSSDIDPFWKMYPLFYDYLCIWYSAVRSIHGDTISHTLHVFAAQATFHTLSYHFYEREPPLPRSTPLGAYRSASHVRQYLPIIQPSVQDSHIHSLIVDRSMVVGHVPMDHMCSFMCTPCQQAHLFQPAHWQSCTTEKRRGKVPAQMFK